MHSKLLFSIDALGRLAFAVALATLLACADNPPPPVIPALPTNPPMSTTPAASGKAQGNGKTSSPVKMDGAVAPPDESADADAGSAESELRVDGDECTDDAQCASAHCDHHLCCSGGECCIEARDCKADKNGMTNVCDYANTCQGSRGTGVCRDFRCATDEGTPDDTACDDGVEANDCGAYPSVYCSGERDQEPPKCADACESDDQCDDDAHCTDGACVRRAPVPGQCKVDPDCASGARCVDGMCKGATTTTSSASASCLQALGNDKCSQCACTQCAETATACASGADTRCKTLLQCALGSACVAPTDCGSPAPAFGIGGAAGASGASSASSASSTTIVGGSLTYGGCLGRNCYCGPNLDCYVTPSGPCARQIEAAAGTDMWGLIMARSRTRDATSPAIFDAERHVQCLTRSCRAECGL